MTSLRVALTALLMLNAGSPAAGAGVELKPRTVAGFDGYVQATEARIRAELAGPGPFLYIDRLPEPERSKAIGTVRRGGLHVQRLESADAQGQKPKVDDGMIHHWFGCVFAPGATLQETLSLVQDYDRHHQIFKPELVRSRLISRSGNDFRIYYRLRKKKIITVTLNTEHDVHYTTVDSRRFHSTSHSTRIQEVENADESDEREKPVGQDNGFMWRLYSYWRFEERDGGVYIECESVSLSRSIHWSVAWFVRPFVTELPRESLESTLGSLRSALVARTSTAGP